jgi:hypothetical protein
MKSFIWVLALITIVTLISAKKDSTADKWVSLFDGKTLNGWKASEHPETFSVADGKIVVHGERAHLFYVGDVNNHNFKNFEFKAEVMTKPHANSGMYFHTEYQDTGWPAKGYEVQVNNSNKDWRKTGSIYGVKDLRDSLPDNKWFTEHIIVKNRTITVKLNDKIVNEYVVPDSVTRLSSGTFALQGHDPGSEVYYRKVMVKPLD